MPQRSLPELNPLIDRQMLLNLSEICSYNALRVRFQLIPLDARRIPQSGLRRICGHLRQVCGDVPTYRGPGEI